MFSPLVPSRVALALMAALTLSACGGGGGGEDDESTTPTTSTGTGSTGTNGGSTGTGGGTTGSGSGSTNTGGGTAISKTPLELALETGDISKLAGTENLADEALKSIERTRLLDETIKKTLFSNVTALSWNPTHDSALLTGEFGINTEVLNVNADKDGNSIDEHQALAIAGKKDKSAFIVLGGHPLRNWRSDSTLLNDGMIQFLKNSVDWLTNGKSSNLKITLAQTDDSYWFRDEPATREWLTQNFGTGLAINAVNACDGAELKNCLAGGSDLLIISQFEDGKNVDEVMAGIRYATEQGIPVLYMHHDGGLTNLGSAIFNHFNVRYASDNYWPKSTIRNASSANAGALPTHIGSIKSLLNSLFINAPSFVVQNCDANCANTPAYSTEFKLGASAIKSMFDAYDARGFRLFDQSGYELQKLLVLLADQTRQKVDYPFDVKTSNTVDFLKSYFTDHLMYVSRNINPVQPDMGNYSRSDFSHITPTNKTIALTSKASFRAAGVYALPGKTVRITRTDSNDVNTGIRINTIRSGATHEWDENGYNRPKYLSSTTVPIKQGQTIEITSPYGGPIHITFSGNDVATQFEFSNVGEHPFWSNSNDDSRFAQAMAAKQYDWAEFVTPHFEVHSKIEKMSGTLNNAWWPTPQALANTIMAHDHSYVLSLVGYQGPNIVEVSEINQWASTSGFTLQTIDRVQHMNADQATCGAGCSGNPYDAYWTFNPVGHGDIHEVGHNHERGRFLFKFGSATQGGHGVTNFYANYSRTMFDENTGNKTICTASGAPKYRAEFDALVSIANSADPGATVAAIMERATLGTTTDADPAGLTKWGSYDYNYHVWGQLQMHARRLGKLDNGHHLIARMHIIERELNSALGADDTWLAKRASLGFANYTRDEAKAIGNNDFIAIAASKAVGLDYRQPLNLWGVLISAKADQQIAANAHTVLGRELLTPNDYCAAYVKNSRNIAELSAKGVTFSAKSIEIKADAVWPWPAASLTSSKTTYALNEKVTITYANAPGNAKDWIGIYSATVTPSTANSAKQWFYTNGNQNGTMTFNALPAGDYKAHLFENDGYTLLSSVSFKVQ